MVRRVSGDDTGAPSRGVVILCMLLTLVAAWVTDFIGIDAIFGAFVAGIIVPREHRCHGGRVESWGSASGCLWCLDPCQH